MNDDLITIKQICLQINKSKTWLNTRLSYPGAPTPVIKSKQGLQTINNKKFYGSTPSFYDKAEMEIWLEGLLKKEEMKTIEKKVSSTAETLALTKKFMSNLPKHKF